nr:hypothetical protein [Planctomycetota bacterium]
TVIFTPLTRFHLRGIVALQLNLIGKRLEERNVRLVLSDAALDRILKEAYDPQYGARPLKRYLERQVSNALSRRIISGDLPDGAEAILEPDSEEGLSIRVVPPKPARIESAGGR